MTRTCTRCGQLALAYSSLCEECFSRDEELALINLQLSGVLHTRLTGQSMAIMQCIKELRQ